MTDAEKGAAAVCRVILPTALSAWYISEPEKFL